MRDLYQALGLPAGASSGEIKQTYRELTRRFHPDRNPGRGWAEERYKEVTEAYEILGDPDRRALYDDFGELSFTQGFDPDLAHARQSQDASADEQDVEDTFEDLQHARSTLFQDLLAGLFGGRNFESICEENDEDDEEPPAGLAPGRTLRTTVTLPLQKGLVGGQLRVKIRDRDASQPRAVLVTIPPGTIETTELRLEGEGSRGNPHGDLVIRIVIDRPSGLRASGRDVHLDVPVTLYELYRGGPIDVQTPWGTVAVKLPRACPPDKTIRLRGQGVRRPGEEPGDLYLVLHPQMPEPGDIPLLSVLERLQGDTKPPR